MANYAIKRDFDRFQTILSAAYARQSMIDAVQSPNNKFSLKAYNRLAYD